MSLRVLKYEESINQIQLMVNNSGIFSHGHFWNCLVAIQPILVTDRDQFHFAYRYFGTLPKTRFQHLSVFFNLSPGSSSKVYADICETPFDAPN